MKNPKDARYCPSCGEELPQDSVQLFADNTMNRYRASFACSECGYSGEVIRSGGIDDMTLDLIAGSSNRPLSPNASKSEVED